MTSEKETRAGEMAARVTASRGLVGIAADWRSEVESVRRMVDALRAERDEARAEADGLRSRAAQSEATVAAIHGALQHLRNDLAVAEAPGHALTGLARLHRTTVDGLLHRLPLGDAGRALLKEIDTLRTQLATVTAERDALLLADGGPMKLRAAEALADEVAVLVRRRVLDARSPAGDALLDYRDPPSTPRADRLAVVEAERETLALAAQRTLAIAKEQSRRLRERCHLLAWQQARRLEEREALAGLLESVEIVLERWPPGVARDSLLGALQDEPERARAALAGKGER